MSSIPTAPRELVLSFDIEVPVRGGVTLRCNIARPAGEGRWPVIVARTPYGKDGPAIDPIVDWAGLAREGFAVVVQDVRQRAGSGGAGDFVPFVREADDGADLIAWAAAQPFSSGDVFALGGSYMGFAQWAAATRGPAALRAIAPHQSPSTPWRSFFYRGGVPELGAVVAWFISLAPDILMRRLAHDHAALGAAIAQLMADLDSLLSGGLASLPLQPFGPLERSGLGGYLAQILAADGESPMLRALGAAQDYERITAPALISGGWYDFFCQGAIDQFVGMRARAGSARARERTRLIMGPWAHAAFAAIQGERNLGLAATLGAAGRGGLRAETLRFFREQLADAAPGDAPVKIFVMGANRWRDEQTWPLARTQWTPWYLCSDGHANSLDGDGALGLQQRAGAPDRFIYDPASPVPTWGGSNLGSTELAGPRDQRPIERRADVLVYTSEVLTDDLEITGSALVELWVASSAPDTDFVARLVDVLPDGTAYNLAEGILRARFRADPAVLGPGAPLEPGAPALLRIELTPTSNLFRAGHRVRLDVTSSCFPRWARNLNIWEQRGATLAQAQAAQQTVLHDAEHLSRALLPVIPRA